MDWLIRYLTGFPARPVDIAQMQTVLPELLSGEVSLEQLRRARLTYPVLVELLAGQFSRYELARWASRVEEPDVPQGAWDRDHGRCHAGRCRLSEEPVEGLKEVAASAAADGNPDPPAELHRIEMMAVVGGRQRRPLGTFLDCASKAQASVGEVRRLVVTDPYVLMRNSEQGDSVSGYENFFAYLSRLRFSSEGVAIHINPSPQGGDSLRKGWERGVSDYLREMGVASRFATYTTDAEIHDRFYLAEHEIRRRRHKWTGLFGPSLNGLTSRAYVLVGQLEERALGDLIEQLRFNPTHAATG